MGQVPEEIKNVALKLKANVYFEGGVISHSFEGSDGQKKTIGIIKPGKYHFNTNSPERMDILSGSCQVKLSGSSTSKAFQSGDSFDVPGKSGFDIEVVSGFTEYLCTFGQ